VRWTHHPPHKWRCRFALVPVVIGPHWVWLEWYWARDYGLYEEVTQDSPKES
jgi:hypothetical protein